MSRRKPGRKFLIKGEALRRLDDVEQARIAGAVARLFLDDAATRLGFLAMRRCGPPHCR